MNSKELKQALKIILEVEGIDKRLDGGLIFIGGRLIIWEFNGLGHFRDYYYVEFTKFNEELEPYAGRMVAFKHWVDLNKYL